MNRETLISYSFYCNGEYDRLCRMIARNEKVELKQIDNVLTYLDDDYPQKLSQLSEPPLVLYYKGDLSLLKQPAIAIVGSRQAGDYALEATRRLALHYQDKVIISGLAKGIDACAHQNAAKTIGILGCGIDYYYPYVNKQLIDKVAAEGLILSEYPGLCKPLAYHFPFRNRIISALADTVYIMQSSRKSGTMSTLNEALNLGKEVRVLPYGLFDELGSNNNLLIYEGAVPISSEEIAF